MKVFGDDSVFTGQWIFSSGVEVELQSKSGWRWQPQHTNQVVIFSRLWKVRNHPRIGMSQSSSSPGLIKSCSESPVAHNQAIMAFTKVSCWTLEWVMFLYCLFFFLPENSTLLLLPIFPSYVADIMMVNGERWDLWPRASWKKHNCAHVDAPPPSLPSPTALLFDALFYLQASLLHYTSSQFFYQQRKCDSRQMPEVVFSLGVEKNTYSMLL